MYTCYSLLVRYIVWDHLWAWGDYVVTADYYFPNQNLFTVAHTALSRITETGWASGWAFIKEYCTFNPNGSFGCVDVEQAVGRSIPVYASGNTARVTFALASWGDIGTMSSVMVYVF
jgi:hypothetical protein